MTDLNYTQGEVKRPDIEAAVRRAKLAQHPTHVANVMAEAYWKTGAGHVTYEEAQKAAEYVQSVEVPFVITKDLTDYVLHVEQQLAEARELNEAYEAGLKQISMFGGNLSDEALQERTGPNDAAARGIMYVGARNVSRALLSQEQRDEL